MCLRQAAHNDCFDPRLMTWKGFFVASLQGNQPTNSARITPAGGGGARDNIILG